MDVRSYDKHERVFPLAFQKNVETRKKKKKRRRKNDKKRKKRKMVTGRTSTRTIEWNADRTRYGRSRSKVEAPVAATAVQVPPSG